MPSPDPTETLNIFGLAPSEPACRLRLLPVPFDATASYGLGSAEGPAAMRRASAQLDLLDRRFGRVDRAGIWMEEEPGGVRRLSDTARELAARRIALGEHAEPDERLLADVNAAGAWVNQVVHEWTAGVLARGGVIPGVLGGEHSVSFGAVRACAEHAGPIGVLQIDAHMDLRRAYLGMEWSHASIMHNVLERIPGVERLVQVGVRDYAEEEQAYAAASNGRIITRFDYDWFVERERGRSLLDLCREAVEALPDRVYVSFDIDGLSHELCPGTGTPVPGGLSFNTAALLLETLARSGREVVGFDLVEVSPREGDELDANIGMRILYLLCGAALTTHGLL